MLFCTLIRVEVAFLDRVAPERLGGDSKVIRTGRWAPEGPAASGRSVQRTRLIQRERRRVTKGQEHGRAPRRGEELP